MRKLLLLPFAFLLLPFPNSLAGELEDAQKDLQVIQARIAEEEARYQQAKALMERSQIVAQFMFPDLRKREQELTGKIQKLQAEGTREKPQ